MPNTGKRTDPDVRIAIETLATTLPRWTATEIGRALQREERFAGRVPQERVLQKIVKAARQADDATDQSGLWSLLVADTDDATLVLPVLAEVTRRMGQEVDLTISMAGWIARVRRAAPDIPLWEAWTTAALYRLLESRADVEAARERDRWLSLGLWNPEAAKEAIEKGWVRRIDAAATAGTAGGTGNAYDATVQTGPPKGESK